jgi:uncharacterized protein YyaL (SSP411 family)
LIDLHQVTLETELLDQAARLADEMLRVFGEAGGAGLYGTGHDGEELFLRQQNAFDGVLPSGNAQAAFDLLRLGRITGEERFTASGERLVRAFMGDVPKQPLGFLTLLSAIDYHLGGEVTITLSGKKEDLDEMLHAVQRRFIPNLALRLGSESGGHPALGGAPTAYVCAQGSCRPPVTSAEELGALLDAL